MRSYKPKVTVYLAHLNDPNSEESFFKIGITSDLKARDSYGLTVLQEGKLPNRLQELQDHLLAKSGRQRQPYKWEILAWTVMNTEADAANHERMLLEAVSPCSYRPKNWFSGYTECFLADDKSIILIKKYLQTVEP